MGDEAAGPAGLTRRRSLIVDSRQRDPPKATKAAAQGPKERRAARAGVARAAGQGTEAAAPPRVERATITSKF